ncbi:sigma-70 family RNA polymerase sigma factor [Saltatorellus ferox]
MNTDRYTLAHEELHSDMEWLSRLAHRLVRDPALADDAVQEAWLAAQRRLDARGPEARPSRGQLNRSLRGIVLHALRSARRRRFHEAAGAKSEALPSTEELLALGERQQLLWRHLAALDEPYRSTIMLRFQQSLSTQELAARQCEREDTVRWRTRRGLELLRDSLEREEGGAGLLGMAPLAALASSAAETASPAAAAAGSAAVGGTSTYVSTGAFWMTHKGSTAIIVAVAAALLAGLMLIPNLLTGSDEQLPREEQPTELVAQNPGDSPDPAAVSLHDMPQESSTQRREAPLPHAESSTALAASEAVEESVEFAVASGRVVDSQGHPVEGAVVELSCQQRWDRATVTRPDGSFECPCPAEPHRRVSLVVQPKDHHGFVSVAFGRFSSCQFPPLELERVDVGDLVVAAAGVATGQVVDEHGEPIVGAKITGNPWYFSAETDSNGRFRAAGLDLGDNYLRARAAGFVEFGTEVALKEGETLQLDPIIMERAMLIRVVGEVVDQGGAPVPGATVSHRDLSGDVAEDGTFVIEFPGDGELYLSASAPGFRESKAQRCVDGSTAHFVLHPAGSLHRLQVVSQGSGAPIEGAKIKTDLREDSPLADLTAGAWRWAHAPGSSGDESEADGRLDVLASTEHDWLTVSAPGHQDRTVAPGAAAELGSIEVIALRSRGRAVITGTVAESLPLPDVTTIEVQILERLEAHGDGEGRMVREWVAPPESVRNGASLTAWLTPRPVLAVRSRHLIHTDGDRRYTYAHAERALGRVLVRLPDGQAALSRPFVFRLEGEVEVGELERVALGSLSGRVVLPHPALATSLVLGMEGLPGEPLKVDALGKFGASRLLPGSYFLAATRVPDGLSTERFHRIIEIQPGKETAVEFDPELPPYGEVEVTLKVNGAEPQNGFAVTFIQGDRRFYDHFDHRDGRPARLVVPAADGYHVVVEPTLPGDPNVECQVDGTVDVPPGLSKFDFEVEACTVICSVGEQYFNKLNRAWQFLLTDGPDGRPREPVNAGRHMHFESRPSDESPYLDVTFHLVPVSARNLRLYVEGRNDEPLLNLPFEAILKAGETVRVVLD